VKTDSTLTGLIKPKASVKFSVDLQSANPNSIMGETCSKMFINDEAASKELGSRLVREPVHKKLSRSIRSKFDQIS